MAYTVNIQDDNCRQDDVVYLIGDSSTDSWAGTIDDEDDMTDDQVRDYIKSTKPELFQKLRGMRFSSSRIPLTFKPLRDLRRLFGMDTERQDRNLIGPQYMTSRDRSTILKKFGSPPGGICESTLCLEDPSQNEGPPQDPTVNNPEQNQDQLKLDGVAQKVVLSAAERTYPKIEPAKTAPLSFRDKNIEPDHAFNHPPNSKQALDLRALKQLEIDETLAEVSKYEKALEVAKAQLRHLELRNSPPDASVLITRPFYMEPRADRYKKQGLTPYDRKKHNKAMCRDKPNSTPKPVEDDSLYCYCREPENDREMVRCSKEWCPVGWFHLQCTGLDRLPFLNEEFHCCYCSDGLGPLISNDLLDKRPHHLPEVAANLIDSVAEHYLGDEIETEVVYKERADGQRSTNAPGRTSIYDDEDDEDDEGDEDVSDATDDGTWAAEEYARLRDKVVKWRAVNDPYQRGNVHRQALNPDDDRTPNTSSTTSFFNDDSDNSENGVGLASDSSTIRASSPVVATTDSKTSLTVNKENRAKDFYDQDVAISDPEMTTIDSAEDGDDEGEGEADPAESAYHACPVNTRNLTSNSRSTATTQLVFPPQPSTITDSTRARARDSHANQSNSFLTFRDGLPSHFPSFYDHTTGPRTPTQAPRVSPRKSKRPWGTPVNIKDYARDFKFDFVGEPVSPSPDKKRKFEEVDDGEDEEMVTVILDKQSV